MPVLYFLDASPTLSEGEERHRELVGGQVHPDRRVQAPPLQVPGSGGNQLFSQGEDNFYLLKKSKLQRGFIQVEIKRIKNSLQSSRFILKIFY